LARARMRVRRLTIENFRGSFSGTTTAAFVPVLAVRPCAAASIAPTFPTTCNSPRPVEFAFCASAAKEAGPYIRGVVGAWRS
jgi:hypothetical protein